MTHLFTFSAALAAAIGLALTAAPARAQAIKNGALTSGQVVSASGTDGSVLFSVPAGKSLVLTQLCSEDLRTMHVGTGAVEVPTSIDVQSCQTFVPGIAFNGPIDVKCIHTGTFGFGQHCLATGVLTIAR